jgi:glutamyl-Q tRNA(Asp) synthetase
MTIVTRFAPSPTGLLHLGHAYSALLGWHAARDTGGKFLLRIEDIDAARCRPEFVAWIMQDLLWLGLDWDGDVRHQSQHLADYIAPLERLKDMGVIYPCFCTRAAIKAEVEAAGAAPHGPNPLGAAPLENRAPLYPGTCRKLSSAERNRRMQMGEAFALRLDVAKAAAKAGKLFWEEQGRGRIKAEPATQGDVVLARKDTPTSYHLAVTVDDALQGVTLVTRGTDLFASTHVHRLLQALLGYATPIYRHHELLTDISGRRYAKRDNAISLRALREDGRTPKEVRAMAGFAQGPGPSAQIFTT